MQKQYNVIDLFCGAGGLSYGFEQAGFNVVLGIDNDSVALKTFEANHKNAKTICGDITDIKYEDHIKPLLKEKKVDVIIGGPPCQGFSVSGKRLIDDERNKLYKSFVRIVSEIMPKIFVMENVPGLVRLFDGKIGEQVIEDFSNIGYAVKMKILSADNFGVPQQRKRVFFVGINRDKLKNVEYVYPTPFCGDGTNIPAWTCKDAIGDLDFIPDNRILGEDIPYEIEAQNSYQQEMRKNSKSIYNHSITLHNQKTKDIIALVPDGGNYKDLPENLRNTRKVHIAWTRMNSNKPCFTIDTGHNHHFHYKENRVPTVRESARIQSFPDNFRFIGIKTSQLKQVGNAVPPLLAKAVAESILSILNRGKKNV